MKIIGITGLIGSGKSTVCNMLAEQGAKVINADEIGHSIYAPNTSGFEAVIKLFGDSIVKEDGCIDRRKLANIVFNDDKKLDALNKLVHPLIAQEIKEQIKQYKAEGAQVVVVEAALLVEAGYKKLVDEIWLTTAPLDMIVERLQNSRGLTKAEILQRLRRQLTVEEMRQHATQVIATSNTLPEIKERIIYLYNHL